MRKLLVYLLLAVLILGAFLPTQPVLASNITLAEYIGIVRVTNIGTTATNVFTVFNVTTQDLIDGDFVFQNLTNTNMQTNAGADTEYMPAPGTGQMWCVYVPSILENSSLDYKLYIGGQQDMDGEIRYFPANNGMTTLDAATLEPGADLETLANNWTIEWGNAYADTSYIADKYLVDKSGAVTDYVSSAQEYTAGIYGTTTTFQYHNAGDDGWLLTIDNATDGGQTFTTKQRHYIAHVRLLLEEILGTTGTMVVALQATVAGVPTGVDLVYDTIDANTIAGAPGAWYQFDFTPYQLDANTTYAIVAHSLAADPLTNFVYWRTQAAGAYGGGQAYWTVTPPVARAWDGMFEEWGYVYAEASSIASGKKTSISIGLGTPAEASGNTLHFVDAANSQVDCGAIYNAQANSWFLTVFRLDADFTSGGVWVDSQTIVAKQQSGNDHFTLRLDGATGKLNLNLQRGGAAVYTLTSTQTTWLANVWYYTLITNEAVAGGSLRYGTLGSIAETLTDPGVNTLPNGGNLMYGHSTNWAGLDLAGEIAFAVVGTDTLTAAEILGLFDGCTPGDETDLWYMDEGTGTAIKSYGSAGNGGTVGAANSWETSTAPRNFIISVDGSPVGGHHVIDVPGNGNDWDTCQLNSMPFVEYQEITVDGVQRQYVEWENDETTFTDQSGNSNDAAPTFRTSSSDVDVTAELISFSVVTPAAATGWYVSSPGDMIGAPTDPGGLYNETISTSFPFLPLVTDVMSEAGITPFFFIVPFFLLIICIVGLLVGRYSLMAQWLIMTVMCFLAAPFGIPPWIGILFLLDGLAVVIASKHYSW